MDSEILARSAAVRRLAKAADAASKPPEVEGVKRPSTPTKPADPRDLKVSLDDQGRVPIFNFIGQPWPDVLQWLANLGKYSLDWQEMPADYLNLTTQRSYTVDEVRDLINRHLVARGFTTVVRSDVLSVFRIKDVDPSLVPRVSEDELYDLRPYEFVKITFEIPRNMDTTKAPEDLKKILSPYARIFPLVSTKRLVVMDVATNLLAVSQLLNEERSGGVVPREFVLRYARAGKVIETLFVILGINADQQPQQADMALNRQRLQAIFEIAQSGGDVSSRPRRTTAAEGVFGAERAEEQRVGECSSRTDADHRRGDQVARRAAGRRG